MGKTGTLVAIALILGGCGASVQTETVHPQRAEARAEAVYAGALQDALEVYEQDLAEAVSRWYGTYGEAYAASQDLIEPDLTQEVRRAIEARGRTLNDLNAWAAAHPEFVATQNAAFQARIAELAPSAFAVMGRIDPILAPPPLDATPVEATEGGEALAQAR